MRVSDTRGTLRGLAFGVDRDGTLVTAHEVVDGLAGLLLGYPDGSSLRIAGSGIVPLPACGLALLRAAVPTGGPWPLADGTATRLVTVAGPGAALQGAVTGLVTARYEASERFWLLPDVWQLGLEQAPYGLPVHAAGGPVVDAETGAAVGVATAALRSRRRGAVLAVRLGAVAAEPALADLLARNAETVPAHGRALNLAGVLELAAAGIDAAATEAVARRVPRVGGLVEAAQGWDPVRPVLAVVGEAGSGRTTELAALALHRTRAAYRLPTLWLRGADLAAGDASVLDAADRALARVHTLLRHPAPAPLAGRAARVAAAGHRPLLIVLDGPEEAPPQVLARWRGWCAETVRRLRGTECRLLVGCLPEFWEHTSPALAPDDVQGCHVLGPLDPVAASALARRVAPAAAGSAWAGGGTGMADGAAGAAESRTGVGPSVWAGVDVRANDSAEAAEGFAGAGPSAWAGGGTGMADGAAGVAAGSLAGAGPSAWAGGGTGMADGAAGAAVAAGSRAGAGASGFAAGPGGAGGAASSRGAAAWAVASGDALALRLFGEITDAQPALVLPRSRPLTRPELLSAWLDLACLRIAERLSGPGAPPGLGPHAVRRLAARVAGRCHEAARRMLGAPDGGLTAGEFDELFPWADGWAQAAIGEGLFVAAGTGYRLASGALGDRLQGFHLDLPAALTVVLADSAPPPGEGPSSRPVGAHRRGGPLGWAPPVPVQGRQVGGGVPRWRLAVVRQALLALGAGAETGAGDPQALEALLSRLVLRLDGPDAAVPGSDAHWWAERLLSGTLHRLPDAGPFAPLLRALAARVVYGTTLAADAAGQHDGDREGMSRGIGTAGEATPAVLVPGRAEAVGTGGYVPFLPWDFWRRLPLTVEARLDVLRVLARAEAVEPGRLLGEVLVQQPTAALPPLCGWLADERVSGIAAETLFAHRSVALDELAESLVDTAHPRADALLRALAQAEPSALARAVDRWAHDPRPERHVAAASVLPLLADRAAGAAAAERTLLRLAAETLLARGDEPALHGAAYAALVCDPAARPRHLAAAVARYLAGDPLLGAAALTPALDGDPALVLSGYAGRLREPGEEAAAVLRALGPTPAPRARAAAARLVREYLQRRPEAAAQVGAWMRARLAHGPAERETLLAFARNVAAEQPEPVRRRVAEALAEEEGTLAQELRRLLNPAVNPAVTSPMRIGDQAHGKV
ncbi:hypothetical protein [Streptacidiphilus sp. MAP12-33]|uniref:hypothetical protein n=1 Tax=Streptacidiphilus sp. MAP12-33 TaxID=3156266 RepID=UPI0035142D6B